MREKTGTPSKEHALKALEFQLEILKKELDTINEIIARQDGMSQTTKNWAVVCWTGSVAFTLSDASLRHFVGLTATLPVLFWYIDATFRRLQARTIFRGAQIRDWLNSDQLAASFEKGKLQGFTVFDPTSQKSVDTPEYRRAVALRRTLRYPEIRYFYGVPAFISLVLQIVFSLL